MIENTDLAAERSVLAGVYSYGLDAYLDVAPMVSPFSFTDRSNQAIYKCFEHLFENKKVKQLDESSFFATAQELGYTWLVDHKDEISHVRSIFNTHILLDNVRLFSGRIRRLEITRDLRRTMRECDIKLSDLQGDEPMEHILGIPERCIFDFTAQLVRDGGNEPRPISEGMREHIEHRMNNPVDMVGIPSPWPIYNAAIGGGFRRKAVSMMGARSGVGKSILADNISLHMAQVLNIPTLYLDTEMSDEDHWYRTGANIADVSINELETGKVGKDKKKRAQVMKMLDLMEDHPFDYLNVSGNAFEETVAIMRRWIHKNVGFDEDGRTKDCLIVYDYLKMSGGESMSFNIQEYQLLGFMATTLHNLAVRNDVPVVCMTQLNRDGIDKESADVVAGSDRVVWLATNFALYKPKSDEEITAGGLEDGTHKLIVIKQRHGPGMARGDYINMKMKGDRASIVEGKSKYQLKKEAEGDLVKKPDEAEDIDEIPLDEEHEPEGI